MVATLLVPIHVAVLIGVILSLLLVGINSASSTHVSPWNRVAPGSWRRAEVPGSLPPGQVTVLDIEGSGEFASVPALFAQLPQPPEHLPGAPDASQPIAVVLRLRGHLRTNLTFTKALEDYAEAHLRIRWHPRGLRAATGHYHPAALRRPPRIDCAAGPGRRARGVADRGVRPGRHLACHRRRAATSRTAALRPRLTDDPVKARCRGSEPSDAADPAGVPAVHVSSVVDRRRRTGRCRQDEGASSPTDEDVSQWRGAHSQLRSTGDTRSTIRL